MFTLSNRTSCQVHTQLLLDANGEERLRFKFRENIPAVAAQETLKGAQKSSDALEFQDPPAQAKQTIHAATHWTWKFVFDDKLQKWIKNGKHYAPHADGTPPGHGTRSRTILPGVA